MPSGSVGRGMSGAKMFSQQSGMSRPVKATRLQQLVVVDLAEAGTAVLVLGEVAVVLDAEAADLVGTRSDVGDGIDVEVVHHVAGVVVDLDSLVVDLADDLGAGGPGARSRRRAA